MSARTLDVLLVAREREWTDRLESLLAACSRPSLAVVRTDSVDQASLVAGRRDMDALVLDAELAPEIDRGILKLPTALLSLPVIVAVAADRYDARGGPLPEGVADFLVPDRDPPHVVERLLSFASQRHAMFRTLREAEAQLRAIVENISDGVIILAEHEQVLYANPAAESILDRPLYAMIGAPVPFTVPGDGPATVEYETDPSSPKTLHVKSIAILWERRHARLVTVRDITAEHAIQANLREARDEAERVAALKTSFLANMSHELRMPLASMIGYAQLIAEATESDDNREFANSIAESGNRLLETITSILDLTRLDADAIQAEARPVSVSAIVREAVGMLSALASRKGLPVEIEDARADDTVHTDPAVLRRILANLIGNAIKFTESGSVTVRVEADASFVRTHVTDTGRGIDPAFLPRLFDEFTQESSGFGRSHEGSGLGLAITRRLCDMIGAEIGVESTKGEGTTFSVVIPHESAWTP